MTSTQLPVVSVVIVHYSAPDELQACLAALSTQTVAAHEIVVVDNGTGEQCRGAAEEFGAEVLALGSNLGYAAAVNTGIARTRPHCDAVLVMTHDCVAGSDCIERLGADLAASKDIGAIGPLVADSTDPDRVWSAGGGFGRRSRRPFHLEAGRPVASVRGGDPVDVDWLDGACIAIRCVVFAEVGPLDESWFLYVEELDWLRQVRAAGWRVVCDRSAVVHQRPGGTPPYLEARNLLRWFIRSRQPIPAIVFVAGQLALCFRALLAGEAWQVPARLGGLRDGMTGALRDRYLTRRR